MVLSPDFVQLITIIAGQPARRASDVGWFLWLGSSVGVLKHVRHESAFAGSCGNFHRRFYGLLSQFPITSASYKLVLVFFARPGYGEFVGRNRKNGKCSVVGHGECSVVWVLGNTWLE